MDLDRMKMKSFISTLFLCISIFFISCGNQDKANDQPKVGKEKLSKESTSNKYSIASSSGKNGVIFPAGEVEVSRGVEKSFLMTPDPGYEIDTIIVDGKKAEKINPFVFNSVNGPHKIEVTFKVASVWWLGGMETRNVEGVIDIALGRFAFALKSDGSVVGWGNKESADGRIKMPDEFSGDVVKIAGCFQYLAALKKDGRVVVFSLDKWWLEKPFMSVEDIGMSNISNISSGHESVFGIKNDGSFEAWGDRDIKNAYSNFRGVIAVEKGYNFILILKADGTIELIGGDEVNKKIPVEVKNVKAIAAGYQHSLALLSNGKVIAWGLNEDSQCMVPEGLTDVIAISAGHNHSLALKSDGKVIAWGNQPLALISDGNIIEWGNQGRQKKRDRNSSSNNKPKLMKNSLTDIPKNLPPVKAIEAGYHSSFFMFKQPEENKTVIKPNAQNVKSNLDNNTLNTYTIKSSFGPNGTIEPSGEIRLKKNEEKNYLIAPNLGYRIDKLEVDDIAIDPQYNYVFKNIDSSHKINVTFKARNTLSIGKIILDQTEGIVGFSANDKTVLGLKADGSIVCLNENKNFIQERILWEQQTNIREIALYGNQILALKNDGNILMLGRNQLLNTKSISNIRSIAFGNSIAMILRNDGTIKSKDLASIEFGWVTPLTNLRGLTNISICEQNHLVLKYDGSVVSWFSWGPRNSSSQELVPSGLKDVIAIATGKVHSVVLKSDGQVVVWGRNDQGQLNVPADLADVKAISAGIYHTIALKKNGEVVGWGNNGYGQTKIPIGMPPIKSIYANNYSTFFVFEESISNLNAEKKVEKIADKTFTITSIAGSHGVIYPNNEVSVISGENITFMMIPDLGYVVDKIMVDDVEVEGKNEFTFSNVAEKHKINVVFKVANFLTIGRFETTSIDNVKKISVGQDFILALKNNGTVIDLLGEERINLPKIPDDLIDVVDLDVGAYNSVGLKRDGTVIQLGTNIKDKVNIIKDLEAVHSVVAGRSFCAILKKDGTVATFGKVDSYKDGITETPVSLKEIKEISAGANHILALRGDGTVVAWGNNRSGQSNVPDELTGVIAIASGDTQSVALKNDGTIAIWGKNNNLEKSNSQHTPPPTGLSGIVSIALGGYHAVALKSDGTVVAWGNNDFGQISIPKNLPPIKAIAAGGNTTVFIFK